MYFHVFTLPMWKNAELKTGGFCVYGTESASLAQEAFTELREKLQNKASGFYTYSFLT